MVQTETVSAGTEGRALLPRTIRARVAVRGVAERWSLLLAFVTAFVFFSVARPHTFLTWDNARAILDDSSVGCVFAVGVTAILVIGEFDLSVGFVAGLAGAAGVSNMAYHGWGIGAAVAVAIAAGGVSGLANGVAVAYVRIPSFIATLAVGSIAAAIELAVTKTAIFQGLSGSYLKIASTVPSFSVEKRCAFPICRSSTSRNDFSSGIEKPAFAATTDAGRAIVSAVRCPSASQYARSSSCRSRASTR